MKHTLLCGLVVVLVVGLAACDDTEESTYKSENCAVVTALSGQSYELCCRLTCVAEYDWDDFTERCTEEATCTSGSGAACPASVVLGFGAPPCLY